MTCKCDEIAQKAYDESQRLKELAQRAMLAGDNALANEARAVSRTLLAMALFVKTGDEKEINRLVVSYQIVALFLSKVEGDMRRRKVSAELCGNEP